MSKMCNTQEKKYPNIYFNYFVLGLQIYDEAMLVIQ